MILIGESILPSGLNVRKTDSLPSGAKETPLISSSSMT